uniref:Uncharacterized protein n=1 Tax=Meloidogyne javanica TaxID=6303 RepID=A0A915MUY3_MELJA
MLWEFNAYVAVCLVNLGHESECGYYFNRSRGETYKDDPRFSPMNYRDLSDLLNLVWSLENDSASQRRAQHGAVGERSVLHPTLVHSRAGMNRAGTYVAASIFGRHMSAKQTRTLSLNRVVKVCKSLRSARYDILNRRSQFILLLETIIELAVRSGVVNEKDVDRARDILRRVRDEIGRHEQKADHHGNDWNIYKEIFEFLVAVAELL